jgi:negative regulator of sigma E activity
VARLARLITRNYVLRLAGKEQVSGRSCYVVTLTPRSDVVHAIKLWIDTRTFFTISRQENNAHGHTISLTLFRWVEFPGALADSSLASPFPATARAVKSPLARVFNNIDDLRRSARVAVCVPVSMPGGFEFERCELVDMPGCPTLCLRFTDGWTSISIYQSRADEQRRLSFRAMRYSRHTMGDCAIEYATPEMNFTLIGRVEMNGLVCIANALDPSRERTYLENTAKAYRVPMNVLSSMRSQGLGIDTINALLEISARSRRSVSSLTSLVREGYCWHNLARQLRVDSQRFANRIRYFECR